jgi:hypothetical protein
MDEPTIGVLRSLQREKIEVTEMRISDLINAIEDVLASKDQQIERYREALEIANIPIIRKSKEIAYYRAALQEIGGIARASEGVEFYAMLADRALAKEGFNDA